MFLFKQKTAFEMRISDWSSDVCSSDLDSEGNDGDQGVDPMEFPREDRECEQKQSARHHEPGETPREAIDLAQQWRRHRFHCLDQAADSTDLGSGARGRNHAARLAGGDKRTGKGHAAGRATYETQ